MVGDSAITRRSGTGVTVTSDAVKVQYSAEANIGFAMWGRANVGLKRIDFWLRDFIASEIHAGNTIEDVGQRLTSALNNDISARGGVTSSDIRGIHIAGYRDHKPVLFQITGSAPLVFHHDYPDDQKITPDQFALGLKNGGEVHLRNGLHTHFAILYEASLVFAGGLKAALAVDFPQPSLRGRLDYYKILVRFVADTLLATGQHPGVNQQLSAIAFDCAGLQHDERLAFGASSVPSSGSSLEF
jgi:hypothetical protein